MTERRRSPWRFGVPLVCLLAGLLLAATHGVSGGAEIRTGAWMNRGTIVSMKPLQMMPTFEFASDRDPTFLSDYAGKVKEFGIDLPHTASDGSFRLYSGDLAVSDKGEILVWQPA